VEVVSEFIDKHDLQVEYILLTHGHVDHVFGVPVIREQTGAPVYMHPLDRPQLERNPTVIRQFGLDPEHFGQAVVDHELVATYFDTTDLALAATGVTLRRRTGGEDAGWRHGGQDP